MTAPVDEINTSSKRVKKRGKVNMTPEMIKEVMEPLVLLAVAGIFTWVIVTLVRMP